MAEKIIEFTVLQLKPEQEVSQDYQALKDLASSNPGIQKQYFGRQIENPDHGVHLIVWSSRADAQAASAALASKRAAASLGASEISPPQLLAVPAAGQDSLEKTLASPCLEVATAYGAEKPGFAEAAHQFAAILAAERPSPKGYHGIVVGESVEQGRRAADGEEGWIVRLLIGWDSREAHAEAKGTSPAIVDNIYLIRSKRKEMELYHVPLKQI